MKRLAIVMLFAMLAISSVRAQTEIAKIGSLPVIENASPKLKVSLNAIRTRVKSDAQDCLEAAKGMATVGRYSAAFKNVLELSRVMVLEVSGTMICDGIHSSSYRYGVALEKETGKQLDLNRIYNIANRQDGRLFLRPELVNAAMASYRQANKNNRGCLDGVDWEVELTSIPITFSPQSDGSVLLYYAAPDVSAACFPSLRLAQGAFVKFRNAKQASQYKLP